MKMRLLLVLSGLALASAEFYSESSGVVNLTDANFDDLVGVNEDEVWIVEFYAPWCGHCKALTPEFKEAAKNLKGLAKVGAVDADAGHNKPLASRFGIRGFPTLKVFVGTKAAVDYQGARTASAISKDLLGRLPSKIKKLETLKKLRKWKKGNDKPKVVHFGNKESAVFKALSGQFKEYADFAFTDTKAIGKEYGIKLGDNTVGLFKSDELKEKDQEPVEFNKTLGAKMLAKFLRKWIPEIPASDEAQLPKIEDESCFQALCVEKGLCVILATTGDKDGDLSAHDVLVDVKENEERAGFFAFSQIDGQANRDWLKAGFGDGMLEQMDYGVAQIIVVSPKKKRYAKYVGSNSYDTVKNFIIGIMGGKTSTSSLAGDFPELDTSGEKCKRAPKKPKPKPKREEPEEPAAGNAPSGKKGHSKIPEYVGKKNLNTQEPGTGSKFIVHATAQNFDAIVSNSNQPAIVEFYAPWCGHCKSLAGPYAKAAENVKGMVLFVGMDCNDQSNQPICSRYGIRGFPSLKTFPVGQKDNPRDYNGARSAGALAKAALGMLTGKVTKVTDDNLGEFLAGEGKKFLLFSDKNKTPKTVRALKTLYPKLGVGVANNEQEAVIAAFGVDSYPTIALVSGTADAAEKVVLDQAKPKFLDIAKWIAETIPDQIAAGEGGGGDDDEDEDGGSGGGGSIGEVKSQEDFDEEAGKGGLLGVAFIGADEIVKARAGDSDYVKTLQTILNSNPDAPYRFVFADLAAKSAFAGEFGVDGDFGLVLMNVRKKRYAKYDGKFSKGNVEDFIGKILKGKIKTQKIAAIPDFDGADGKEEL